MLKFSLCVVTTSRNRDSDLVGPVLQKYLEDQGDELRHIELCTDTISAIQNALLKMSEQDSSILLFSGGTGLTSDDVTPEALEPMYQRKLPGFDEAMRMANFAKIPGTILSRGVSGVFQKKLVISLPGSPKAVVENLSVVYPVLSHAVKKISDDKSACV
ncbi:MAG: MogA/MoaB family molybdenum cofactor biosynthesis protein [Bacteriovoracaceae bacterium]